MSCYQKMYRLLFNQVTDALEKLEQGQAEKAKDLLYKAQQKCEEIYIKYPEYNDKKVVSGDGSH